MALFNIPEQEHEIWKDVVGFEGYYQVSNLGRVKRLKRVTCDGKHIAEKIKESNADGGPIYRAVQLYKDNVSYNRLIHRLVAEAFIPNPENLLEVNHKDCNPRNNRVENLEWVSSATNSKHRIDNKKGGYSYRKPVKCLETGQIFPSLSAAGKSVQASTQQVIDSIDSQRCCKGVTFVYADSIPENIEDYLQQAHAKYQTFHRRPIMKNARKVSVVETGQVFDSMASAARFFDCDTATINNRIKAAKPFGGVTLKFVE